MNYYTHRLALFLATAFISLASTTGHAEIARLSVVDDGVIRGGQPESVDDYQMLKETYQVKTVINLRESNVDEDASLARGAGLDYISYPLDGTPVLGTVSEKSARQILAIMNDPTKRPVFIHCHHGKDRTGLLVGLYRVFTMEWEKADAYNEMMEIGFDTFWYRSYAKLFNRMTKGLK